MSDHSAIEWTNASWNPVTGCTKLSAGCDYCYAVGEVDLTGIHWVTAGGESGLGAPFWAGV